MDQIELSKDERGLLARRYRDEQLRQWGWKLVGLFSAFAMAAGAIFFQRLAKTYGYQLDGKLIFVPLLLAVPVLIAIQKPAASPRDRIGFVLAERREKAMTGLLLATVALGLVFAIMALIQRDSLSFSALLFPVLTLTQLFSLMHRQDEATQAISAVVLRGGFLLGFASMTMLAVAAIYAPATMPRIIPLAMAAPVAFSALLYLGLVWRAGHMSQA